MYVPAHPGACRLTGTMPRRLIIHRCSPRIHRSRSRSRDRRRRSRSRDRKDKRSSRRDRSKDRSRSRSKSEDEFGGYRPRRRQEPAKPAASIFATNDPFAHLRSKAPTDPADGEHPPSHCQCTSPVASCSFQSKQLLSADQQYHMLLI